MSYRNSGYRGSGTTAGGTTGATEEIGTPTEEEEAEEIGVSIFDRVIQPNCIFCLYLRSSQMTSFKSLTQ